MKSVLIIADLEGVAGVDDVSGLSAVSDAFPRGRRLLTDEVLAAMAALRARGVERIVVSDSHRPGSRSPTVIPEDLGAGVELAFEGDAYDAALFRGVDAVACVGMHAAAGTRGFAAHTVSINCAIEQDGRGLSETDLVLALAAEHGVEALFVSGDDVLARTLPGLTTVISKTALSPASARSRPVAEVHAAIAAAAAAPPIMPGRRSGDLQVRFKSRWMAERAGGERAGPHTVRVTGGTFGEAYARALVAIAASDRQLEAALRTHDLTMLNEDISHLLLRGFPAGKPAPRGGAARRALAWFLQATAGPGPSSQIADRALVLHMLEGHAPGFFSEAGVAPALDEALRALAGLPVSFPIGLDPAEAMGQLDGLYLLSEHGAARDFDHAELDAYVRWLAGDAPVIWAWLLGEIMVQMGLARPISVLPRAHREQARQADLYWLTHLYLLETRYLRRPLAAGRLDGETEELCLAVPEILAGLKVDLAAEIAICLQAAGEEETAEHHALLDLIARSQAADGRVVDPSSAGLAGDPEEDARLAAHATGAALVALARFI